MSRPYALMRAGFPYVKTLGEFRKIRFPSDLAITNDGIIYSFGVGSNYGKGFSGPLSLTNLDDDDLGSFGWLANELPVPDGAFMWPSQVVMDSNEVLYLSDQACHRITIYSRWGEFLGKWGDHGHKDGQIDRPAGLAFDSDENLLVVDTMNHRVQKFTKDGRFIMSWGSFGSEDGQFNMPWGITLDDTGNVYVSDWRNDRVQKFTTDGEFIWKFGVSGSDDGQLRRPAGLAVDKDGDIYVCDWGNNRVQLFTEDGRYVQQFLGDATLSKLNLKVMLERSARLRRMRDSANLEPEKYFARPRSVRVDHNGYMYVSDYEHYRIQVYKKEAYPMDESQIIPPFKVPTLNAN